MPKFKKKWVKRTVIAGTAVVIVGAVAVGMTVVANSKSTVSTTTFRAAQASTGTISNSVSESGTATCPAEYALTAANSGTVDKVTVSQGDTVKKGQIIAHINDTQSTETLIEKKSALTTAQNNLSTAQESLDNLYVKAIHAGRIKSINAVAGDDASSISSAFGYLMYLSISGKTQVSVNSSQSLVTGTPVAVKVAGMSYSGTVGASTGSSGYGSGSGSGGSGNLTVTINSDIPAIGANATVLTTDGKTVGTGTVSLTSDAIKISGSGSGGGSNGYSSSTISAIYVTENQTVSKGNNLLKYDDSSVQSQISQKQQMVDQAQSDVENAQQQVDKDTITSPVDGVIASLSVKQGDNVQSSGSIATVIDQNQMETVLSVDEDDISKIKVGQSANVTLDAISGKTYSGKVTKVDSLGTTSNNVTTYSVTVTISSPTGIKVGMTTNAEIIIESKDNAVIVPASALLLKMGTTGYVIKSDSLAGVTKLKNVTTRELMQEYGTKVEIGLSNTDQVEITSGVSDGDTVEIPITVNLAAAKSLRNTSSTSSSTRGFGMGGYGMGGGTGGMEGGTGGGYTRSANGGTGYGGYSGNGYSSRTQRSGGTGNTVGS